jgi:hypothetical protein
MRARISWMAIQGEPKNSYRVSLPLFMRSATACGETLSMRLPTAGGRRGPNFATACSYCLDSRSSVAPSLKGPGGGIPGNN